VGLFAFFIFLIRRKNEKETPTKQADVATSVETIYSTPSALEAKQLEPQRPKNNPYFGEFKEEHPAENIHSSALDLHYDTVNLEMANV
jgi:hypothetical protein